MATARSMPYRAGLRRSMGIAGAGAMRWIRACAERRAQRRALDRLDGDRLRDIGLTRAEARAEAAKRFWWP